MEDDTPQKKVKARLRQRRKRERDRGAEKLLAKKEKKPQEGTSSDETGSSCTISRNIPLPDVFQMELDGEDGSSTLSPELLDLNLLSPVGDGDRSAGLSEPEGVAEFDAPLVPGEPPDPEEPPDDAGVLAEVPVRPRDACWFATELLRVRMQSDVSNSAIQKVLDVFLPNLQEITQLYENGYISRNFRHGILPKAGCAIPKIRCEVKVKKLRQDGTEEIIWLQDLTRIPQKYQSGSSDKHVLLCQTAYTTLPEMRAHFEILHPNFSDEELDEIYSHAKMGIDGIRETEHGTRTIIAVTLMLEGCIFPWRILNPLVGSAPDAEELLRPLVDEINADPYVIVRKVVCDMVERHHVKGMKGHTGHHSCEICEAPGNGPFGRLDFDYPRSTRYKSRTNANWRYIARRIRGGHPINRKGLRNYTPLLDLSYPFDIIWDVPVEEFHLLKEGLTKQLMVRLLTSASTTAQEIRHKFNEIYVGTKVFSETPRRTRRLNHIKKFKGSEFGTIMFSSLPSLFKDCIPNTSNYWRDVKRCLASYAFLVRLYFYDDTTYRDICSRVDTKKLHQTFYRTFQKCFCNQYNKGVNPNAHVFWHMPLIREHVGPLWKTSTESSEAYYSKFNRCFRKGTKNVPTQIMEALYKIDGFSHKCRNNFRMCIQACDGKDRKYDNSNITDKRGDFWKVMENIDDETFVCAKVHTEEICTGVGLGVGSPLPWDAVGVKKYLDVDFNRVELLTRQDIRGKFMHSGNYLVEWLPEWFRDSKKNY